MSIVGGLISVEDGFKKSEEYAPARKVRVEIKFDVEPGTVAQSLIDKVGRMADEKVSELLGGKTATRETKRSAVEAAVAAADTVMKNDSPTSQAVVDQVMKKLDGIQPAPTDKELEIPDFLDKKKRTPKKGASIMADANPTAIAATPEGKPTVVADPIASSGEITANDLYKATSIAKDATNNPGAITQLIRKFTKDLPVEKQYVIHIPQESRKAYLDALDALKAFGPAPEGT